MLHILPFVLVYSFLASAALLTGDSRNCSCGFYDNVTGELFTDSIVVYFNETNNLPPEFLIEDYENKYEKDWNAIYRQGAVSSNVQLNNTDSLQLTVSPPTSHHLVNGGAIRTVRRDIQHGSFRTFMRSPKPRSGGSALSMMWQYNETEVVELSIMNNDDPTKAWVGTFVNDEFTTRATGVSFITAQNETAANRNYTVLDGGLSNGSFNPWDYVEYRIDWTKDYINFYIGGNLTRSILHKKNSGMPSVPAPLYFKHWSTGNQYYMKGPPGKPSTADIGWMRLFFNSSSMNELDHEKFAERCPTTDACSANDITIRGSTPYVKKATQKWKQNKRKDVARMPALWISVISISISSLLLLHALFKRAPWRKQPKQIAPSQPQHVDAEPNPREAPEYRLPSRDNSILEDPFSARSRRASFDNGGRLEDNLRIEKADPSPAASVWGGSTHVDYLAGLVALCAVLVTVMHFGLTFVPAMIVPGAPQHYRSELWAQQLVAPFILNQMWLGVFFTTSVRFLVMGYLRRGNMKDIAKAAVRRTPRLMIPVASIAMLEYFLVDIGLTSYLRYIPSITWSTWPYVTRYETAGHFISEVLELIYLVPNAVPQITFNYCTGVLWTIAVQLQGAWLVLCGVIVVYEIKTPWKRMAYYVFCLLNHWYAQSWGSYLWFGLLLTDLDVTYGYKQYLYARPAAYYLVLFLCWLCVLFGFSVNIISNLTIFNFTTYENNIHPDSSTGEALWNTPRAVYPEYYVPRLNGFLFAAGMQTIVELSPAIQWVLSLPPLLVLFPHIFTIYLIHGLVFWSWGSWLMVFLADRGFGYGINVTIVGVTSYVLLFLCLPIVTPIVEALGKDITALVWTTATEKSPPRRRTLFPFPDDLFTRRENQDEESRVSSFTMSGRTTLSEKGKGKETVEVQEISQFGFNGKGQAV
ncbi:glycoside hydrolase family 16 protein [Amniculicola lignicola CBS 123094]|uniref:Glycoside hydrolase family 16 protein n=1 Tax=Amniculicola lignicola CBS 123094 TaxID=1392246 RepID=A0A6A5W551_9PLEO|nr:glycoside hydrolase family 16 protein [Amniculicola lignicola CBS 123094]